MLKKGHKPRSLAKKKKHHLVDTHALLRGVTSKSKNGLSPSSGSPKGTCFQDLAPFKKILSPPDKTVPTRSTVKNSLERPGRHSKNLAGPEGSMNSKAKIALTSPKNLTKSHFKFQPSAAERSPTATKRAFGFDESLMMGLGRKSPKQSKNRRSIVSLNKPYRVEPAEYLKAPERIMHPLLEEDHVAQSNNLRGIDTLLRKRLVDYSQKADACRRESRLRGEGHAYFCMGVIHDNLKEFGKAIIQYEKFVEICSQIDDTFGEALAHNCLGISLYMKAMRSEEKKELISKAIQSHGKHRELGDIRGKFIAHTNIGILYDFLGDMGQSIKHHESALKFSIKLGDGLLQATAVGHLGLAGCTHKDYQSARACMERHLELVTHMGDDAAREEALLHLGYISKMQSDSKAAATYYQQALESAKASQNSKNVSIAKVQIGIIMGNAMMQEHMAEICASFGV